MQFNLSELPPWAKLEVTKEALEAFAKTLAANLTLEANPAPSNSSQEVIWMDDAVQILNLAKPTIYGLLSKGRLPHYKRGRKVYFLRSELEAWLMTGKQKTIADAEQEVENYLSKQNLKNIKS